MKRFTLFSILVFNVLFSGAQELFVYSEPASNMAARSLGIRVNQMMVRDLHKGRKAWSYYLMPGVM